MIKNKRLLLPAALAVASCLSSAALAQTTAIWLSPTSGNWFSSQMWSTNPYSPTSDSPLGATYDAVIDATGTVPAYTIQAGGTVSLDNITVNSALATVDFQSGLNTNTINLDAGNLSVFNLSNTTIHAASAGTLSLLNQTGSLSVDGSLNLKVSPSASFNGNLTLNSATMNWLLLPNYSPGTVTFSANSTIGGTGTIYCNLKGVAEPTVFGSGLTIGAGITMVSADINGGVIVPGINLGHLVSQSSTDDTNVAGFQNRGAITSTAGYVGLETVTNPGTISLANSRNAISGLVNSGSVLITGGNSNISASSNSGSFTVSGGTVNLTSFSTTAPVSFLNSTVTLDSCTLDPSLIQRTGGTLAVRDTLNNLGTLNLDALGPVQLFGTINGGTITGTDPSLLQAGPQITLSNVTIALTAINPNSVTLSGAVTLQGTRVSVGSGSQFALAAGTTLGGMGQIILNSEVPASFGLNSVIGPDITVTSIGSTFTGNLTNQGTIRIPTGANLRLDLDRYSNPGSMQLDGGVLILGNSSKGVGLLPSDIQQNFTRNGGQILLGGSYNFTGQTIDLSNTPLGPVDLGPTSITGGTLLATGRTINFYSPQNVLTDSLNGVTLASDTQIVSGPFSTSNSIAVGANGLTLQNVTVDMKSGGITFNGNTLGGTGTVVFDATQAPGKPGFTSVNSVVIGSNITLISGTGNGVIGAAPSGNSLTVNNGIISTGANGNWIGIGGTGFVNNGTVEAINGGRIALVSPFTNNGSISATNSNIELFGFIDWNAVSSISFNNSNLTISGYLNNTGKTLAVQENGRSLQISPNGNITGGTIAVPNGGTLSFVGQTPGLPLFMSTTGPSLSNLTLAAPSNFAQGASASFSAVDIESPISVNSGRLKLAGNTLVNQPVTVAGGYLELDSISNLSSIAATQNSTVFINSWSQNLGNLTLTDSILELPFSGNTAALIASISRTNSPVRLGTMDLTGQTLTLDRAPAWYLSAAQITGGEIVASQSTPLVTGVPGGGSIAGSLNGVTLKGPLDVGWQQLLVAQNSLTFDNGQIHLISAGDGVLTPVAEGLQASSYGITHPTQFSGNGEIIFDNDPAHNGVASALIGGPSNYELIIGSNITVHNGNGNGMITGPIVSNGIVSASAANTWISIMPIPRNTSASFTNNGTLMAINGGTLNIVEPSLTNFSAGTLTGGTYEAFENSTINFTNSSISASITTNNANILLSGPNSHFDAINALSANLGHFSLLGGRAFTTAGDLSNSGTVSVDDQSLLTVAGGLSLGETSVLDVTLGASHGTMIEVQGSANLYGQLQIELANGFVPASGDQFAFMTAGSFGGNFTSFDLPTLPGSEQWDTSQASAGIISVTPEPSMLGIAGLFSASLLLKRRRSGYN